MVREIPWLGMEAPTQKADWANLKAWRDNKVTDEPVSKRHCTDALGLNDIWMWGRTWVIEGGPVFTVHVRGMLEKVLLSDDT